MEPLRTGIIGLAEEHRPTIDFLAGPNGFEVVAVGDPDRQQAHQVARSLGVEGYDDLRLLIVQEKLDVLVLLQPSCYCVECMALAVKRPLHVFKAAPVARTMMEAAQWVASMDKAGRQFHVEADWRFSPAIARAFAALRDGQIGRITLARGEVFVNAGGPLGYRGDPVLAGGGVLMDLGYPVLGQMIEIMGRPELVYCQHSSFGSKRFKPPLQTEDTALVTLSFAGGAIGHLTCSWMAGPARRRLVFYGTEGQLEIDGDSCLRKDSQGNEVERYDSDIPAGQYHALQLTHFADCVRGLIERPIGRAADHLAAIAVVELAYLSARTMTPEHPKVFDELFKR